MFDLLDHHQVNELHVRNDAASQLKAFIAIHNTHLGPALGGCRFIEYDNEDSALEDAVKLARGMTYKAALAGISQGGGKAVIMKPKGAFDKELLFKEFGRFVGSLNGNYITAIDSGTSAIEMDLIRSQTRHVTSTSQAGNPSPYTAQGVFNGIKAVIKHKLGKDNLQGLRVAIQGIGAVGFDLGRMLKAAGAVVIVADINELAVEKALKEFASEAVPPSEIHRVPCTVFCPCGLSGAINDSTINELGCLAIAGSANVQLAHHDLGKQLHSKGILYAPDYVINAGGLIYASLNHERANKTLILEKVDQIYNTLSNIFNASIQEGRPTSEIADHLAKEIVYGSLDNAA